MVALWWCRASLIGMLILQPVWFGWISPPQLFAPWLAIVVTLLPLLLVTPGVWRLQARGLVVAGCVLLPYFCLAVMEAWANPPARVPAIIQILLITLYFTALPAVRKVPARSD
jgi:uncharacterized membrane protein